MLDREARRSVNGVGKASQPRKQRRFGGPDGAAVDGVGPSALCRTGVADLLDSCGRRPGFHKTRPGFTGCFGPVVEDVGKPGPDAKDREWFSNHPDFNSRVLENRRLYEVVVDVELGSLFHFSCLNYGDYYLFIYLISLFLLPVARHQGCGGVTDETTRHGYPDFIPERVGARAGNDSSLNPEK